VTTNKRKMNTTLYIERNQYSGGPFELKDYPSSETWKVGDFVTIKHQGKNLMRQVTKIEPVGIFKSRKKLIYLDYPDEVKFTPSNRK
jgi:hypothetical protein